MISKEKQKRNEHKSERTNERARQHQQKQGAKQNKQQKERERERNESRAFSEASSPLQRNRNINCAPNDFWRCEKKPFYLISFLLECGDECKEICFVFVCASSHLIHLTFDRCCFYFLCRANKSYGLVQSVLQSLESHRHIHIGQLFAMCGTIYSPFFSVYLCWSRQ